MATLRNAAQNVLNEAREGIAWIALWKEGRGWETSRFYLEEKDDGTVELDWPEDLETLQSILAIDQWSRLVCYLHLSTKYREGERDSWQSLAQEKNADGAPVFKSAASNAAYWQEIIDDLAAMLPKLDGMEV